MPKPSLPPDLVAFLAEPSASVIATIRPDGSPHTAATWYRWVGGCALVNMDEDRRPHPQRDRGRVSAWIEVTSWHAWAVTEPWTGGRDRRVH